MTRRFAALLLAFSLIGGGIASCPCFASGALAMTPQMECCQGHKGNGIGAPSCCPERSNTQPQIVSSIGDAPLRTVIGMTWQAVSAVATIAAPAPPRWFTPCAERSPGPPGQPLLAQHTSLLL